MRKITLLVFVALFAFVGGVAAGGPTYQFVVIPAVPTAGEPIQIAVSVGPLACNRLPPSLSVQMLGGGVIRFLLAGSDACEQNLPAQQQTYTVGGLPAGQYTFRFANCGGLPPGGGDPCFTLSEQTIVISGAGAGATQSVPVLTNAGVAILALCLLAIGATASKQR